MYAILLFRYNHYRKYTHAYNIPIVSTSAVPDSALKRACYVVRFLLGDRKVIRKYMYRYFGRVGIMGAREGFIFFFLHTSYSQFLAIVVEIIGFSPPPIHLPEIDCLSLGFNLFSTSHLHHHHNVIIIVFIIIISSLSSSSSSSYRHYHRLPFVDVYAKLTILIKLSFLHPEKTR